MALSEKDEQWVKDLIEKTLETHVLLCPVGKLILKIKWVVVGGIAVGLATGLFSTNILALIVKLFTGI